MRQGNYFKRHHLHIKKEAVGFLDIPISWGQDSVYGSAPTIQINGTNLTRRKLKQILRKAFKILKEEGHEKPCVILQAPYAILDETHWVTGNLLNVHNAVQELHLKTLMKWMETDRELKISVEVNQWRR